MTCSRCPQQIKIKRKSLKWRQTKEIILRIGQSKGTVLNQNKSVDDLLGPELVKFLLVSHIPKVKHENKGMKLKKLEKIKQSIKPSQVFWPQSSNVKVQLCDPHKIDIKIKDTALGLMCIVEVLKMKGPINKMELDELHDQRKIWEIKMIEN